MKGISPYKAKLLAEHRIRWQLGLNDPSVIGWLTVASYAVAAILAWRAAQCARAAGRQFDRRFWLVVCAAMVLLGINKQLDFHILLTDIGRAWAVDHGWYQQRRGFQKAFMLAVAAGAALVLAWGGVATRRKDPAIRWALGGIVLTTGYILVRAASFHHTDVLMRTAIFGHRWNWAIEVAGIALAGYAAWRYGERAR